MKAINPNEIKDNFIELIGKEWMLVSAGDNLRGGGPAGPEGWLAADL